MDTAAIGVAEEEDKEQGVDQQDIFYGVILFLSPFAIDKLPKLNFREVL